MDKIDKTVISLQSMQRSASQGQSAGLRIGDCALLITTLLYLAAMLLVPMHDLQRLIWFALYPILGATLCGISYGSVFLRSLYLLPLIVLIGIFNPIFDTEPAFEVGRVVITQGWITCCSVVVRGLLAVQAVFILIMASGFTAMCQSMRQLGVPGFLVTQLLMVYRYMIVLLIEAQTMRRAREARGFGRAAMTLSQWGPFVGQLFLRTINRAQRIHSAMQARGFNGTMPRLPSQTKTKWNVGSIIWLIAWAAAFAGLYFIKLPNF